MAETDVDRLTRINLTIAEWEQTRDEEAIANLDATLSPELLFRRADETVVGKDEFIAGLRQPSPFAARESEGAAVVIRGDRALVTLIVTTTAADGSKSRYRNVRMFVRRSRGWQLELWFNDDVTHAANQPPLP